MCPPGRVIYASQARGAAPHRPTSTHSCPSIDSERRSKANRFHVTYVFRPRLAESVLNSIKKGAHVLVEGSLVSSTYEQANGKGKKAKTAKITTWSIRADVVRKLDRGEPEPQASASSSPSEAAPF
jgi:single-stranded DNA-binding protein